MGVALFNILGLQLLLGDATCSAVSNLRVFRVRLFRASAAVSVSAEAAVSGATILIVHGIDSEGCHLSCSRALRVPAVHILTCRDVKNLTHRQASIMAVQGIRLMKSNPLRARVITLYLRPASSAGFQYSRHNGEARHNGDVYLLAPISDVRLELTSSSVYLDEFPGLSKHHFTPFAESYKSTAQDLNLNLPFQRRVRYPGDVMTITTLRQPLTTFTP